jgi:hypothetical protein
VTARFSWNQRNTRGHSLRLRAVALALRSLRLRAVALALRGLRLRAVALALRGLRLRAVALALRGPTVCSGKPFGNIPTDPTAKV